MSHILHELGCPKEADNENETCCCEEIRHFARENAVHSFTREHPVPIMSGALDYLFHCLEADGGLPEGTTLDHLINVQQNLEVLIKALHEDVARPVVDDSVLAEFLLQRLHEMKQTLMVVPAKEISDSVNKLASKMDGKDAVLFTAGAGVALLGCLQLGHIKCGNA